MFKENWWFASKLFYIARIIMQEMSNEILDIGNNNAKKMYIEIVEC
jgi:hypothetical protein